MRINKYIASCGIASRRKADQLIETGKIAVNGDKILEPGYKVQESDIVTYCGEIISPVKEKYYLMLNKPIDYVCTNDDPFAKKTVFDLIDIDAKLFSIGRLDKDSRGLLLITNDGDLYNKLMHPSKLIFKKYKVILDKSFDKKHIKQLSEGVDIGGYVTSQAKIQCTNDRKILYIEISEGKNRQVRRMFKAFNYQVVDLERVAIDKIQLGQLPIGKYRYLTNEEVQYLSSL